MEKNLLDVLAEVQEHIATSYPKVVSTPGMNSQLRSYVENYLYENALSVPGYTEAALVEKLCSEMSDYSVITQYLDREDVEEININSWNDIAIKYTDGRTEKTSEHFLSPEISADIIKKLLDHSGMTINNTKPKAQGHLPGNSRITALQSPLIDEICGIAASIRLLHPSKITYEHILGNGGAMRKMLEFLQACLLFGVSFVIAGSTSAGKTTLLNALLQTVPNEKRIFTIESGARELSLIREENGRISNNVVHTLSRPSENADYNISQEDLVLAALRFNPDVIVVGEMRDIEAFAAVEACLTGHTVVSTIHSSGAAAAHNRLGQLCQKRFPSDIATAKLQAAQAFPIVVYEHRCEDHVRRIMDISECVITPSGSMEYRSLFRFRVTKGDYIESDNDPHWPGLLLRNDDGRNVNSLFEGYFEQPEIMSQDLQSRMILHGIPRRLLDYFLTKEDA